MIGNDGGKSDIDIYEVVSCPWKDGIAYEPLSLSH